MEAGRYSALVRKVTKVLEIPLPRY